MLLVLIQSWGLNLGWRQLSFASITMMGLWAIFALRARREYLAAFRRSIEQQHVQAADVRLDTADLSTIETLVEELAHPDPKRVLYAIDLLESLDKRQLVTPLLLFHESPDVRARALRVAEAAGPAGAERWLGAVERALKDRDADVRLAAVRAVGAIRREEAAATMRPYLSSSDPQLVITAATALSSSADPADVAKAEEVFRRLTEDTRDQHKQVRLEVAQALGQVQNPEFRSLLVPLMYDADLDVARAAIQSAGKLGGGDYLFVPPLVSLLRNRLLKASARQVLVGYGDGVVDALAYFLRDRDEDPWVRRHVPSTLALIPTQKSMDVMAGALADPDGFVRYKAGAAIERLRQENADLRVDGKVVEQQIGQETTRAFNALTLHHNLFSAGGLDAASLLARALKEKHERAVDRVFRLLALVHPPADIRAVQAALRQADARSRSSAAEYLDNLLKGDVRKRVMLLVEDMPADERVRRGNVVFKTRVRDVEDTLAQLVHDDDQVLAACAIHLIEERRLWTNLVDDLEHVLAHRDVRDWFVFEAASWALAAYRMPAERRRALWLEPLPAVELANRLRRMQLFEFVSVDELFRIAGLGRQVRHESGRVLYQEGTAPESLQFLLDGKVVARRQSGETEELGAPAPLAFEEELEGSPMRSTIRAVDMAICLSLSTEEFLSLLSENVEMAQGIFRLLIDTRGLPEWRTVMHGRLLRDVAEKVDTGLQPIDRVRLLQSSPLLSRATAPALLRMAAIARTVKLEPEKNPLEGATEPSILVVLSGVVRVTREGHGSELAEEGDAIGIYETLGGVPMDVALEVTAEGTALRFDRAQLFDLLADHIDLLQGLFSGLMRARVATAAVA
jgi:HEAT repeat protein/CRP-like cAMP-binding protein